MRTVPKIVVLCAAVVLLTLPASALTARDGMDLFVTPGGGQTTVDLSLFPLDQAFGQGATASPSLLPLKGKPIAGLGNTDTVVHRISDVTLSGGGTSGTTAIELVGLRLVSERTVAITVANQTTHWNVEVGLSNLASSNGWMTIQQNTSQGGTFDTNFNVVPRLRFSRAGAADVIIDCGASNTLCRPMTLSSSNSSWVSSDGAFDPSTAGVPSIANNTAFDGDGDGSADDSFAGGTNFFAGFDPVTYHPVPLSHDHPPVAEHLQGPNVQCRTVASEDVPVSDTSGSSAESSTVGGVVVEPADPTPVPVLCKAVVATDQV
ncbi:MAG TPA: hypothetical protein VHQ65_14725 [Thermoanaerobaculia bacterium]|nr:hypothetical protein [Thermoanaerobaculia bacterium]